MNLDEAMKTIKAYCETQADCEACYFYDAKKCGCSLVLGDLPCDWKMPGGADHE